MDQLLFKPETGPFDVRRAVLRVAAATLVWVSVVPATGVAAATSATQIAAQVEDMARDVLLQRAEAAGWAQPTIDLKLVTGHRPLAACSAPVEVEAVDTQTIGRMRFTVRCPADTPWSNTVVVRGDLVADVVVTANAVPTGTPLSHDDLTLARRSVSATPDALGDTQAAVGHVSRRALRSGDIVRAAHLSAPLMVKRGDTVRIEAQREQVRVSMAGEALEAGAKGATVRVRNSSTGKVIRARVVEHGLVEPIAP